MKLSSTIRKTIKKHNMFLYGERVVLGVSGGSDSVACLYLLNELEELRLKPVVVHVNHRLRGKESERDALFTQKLASSLRLPFEIREADTELYAREKRLSVEEAARELRYEFFFSVAEKYDAKKIVTAHTLDDQAETVLMRIIRGSGPKGISGIPPVGGGGTVVRPLIEATKSELRDYLIENDIKWIEDSSNLEGEFLRNRIRSGLLKELERYNPSVSRALANAATLARACEDYIEKETLKSFDKAYKYIGEDQLIGSVSEYANLHSAIRYALLRKGIERVKGDLRRLSFKHIDSADDLLMSANASGSIRLPAGFMLVKGYDEFTVAKESALDNAFSYVLPSEGKWTFKEFVCEVSRSTLRVPVGEFGATEGKNSDSNSFTAAFEFDAVNFPIEVKSFEPGMRFYPLGMNEPKKIKNFFIDSKVPRFRRKKIPIFMSGGKIMWVGGLRIDERFKLRGSEALVIRLRYPGLFLREEK